MANNFQALYSGSEFVPIYQYTAPRANGDGVKYAYSSDPNLQDGWTLDSIAFFVPRDITKFPGMLPVRAYARPDKNGDGERYIYTFQSNLGDGWADRGISFYAFPAPQQDERVAPVYQYSFEQSDGDGIRYAYSLSADLGDGWKLDQKSFYCFTSKSTTAPVYQYTAPQPNGQGVRYFYSTNPGFTSGWTLDSIVFFVSPNPGVGLLPVWEYHAVGYGWRYYYSMDPAVGRGWQRDGVAFYAYPLQFGRNVPIYEYLTLQADGGALYAYSSDPGCPGIGAYEGPAFYCTELSPVLAPVYQYSAPGARGDSMRYVLDTQAHRQDGWKRDRVAFFAPPPDSKTDANGGLQPVWTYVATDATRNLTRYYYSLNPNAAMPGWRRSYIGFYALPLKYGENTVPVYQYHVAQGDGVGYAYSTDPNLGAGWQSDGVAFYCFANPIKHVFVLMLENHSFDNVFGLSGIPGITAATNRSSNAWGDATISFGSGAPASMPTDPGHEFLDVVEQLCGHGVGFPQSGEYPKIDNSGFLSNYATTTSEGKAPLPTESPLIMKGFDTASQLPVMYQLATEFAICDHWFSSLPGPTWPNRFFVHGASSAGLDHSPTGEDMIDMAGGLVYPHGSIYNRLHEAGLNYKLYADTHNAYSDNPFDLPSIAQVSAIKGISELFDIVNIDFLAANVQGNMPGGYSYQYTFIEPHYGDIENNSYQGGSSQHPMDDTYGGEALIKAVYEAIRNSPIWNSSLLIITYDEHGGFYDSVQPPKYDPSVQPPMAAPPDDGSSSEYNQFGFKFDQYGVRVPALVVSPYIPKGTADAKVYDHASVAATLERVFGFPALTNRDYCANDLNSLLTLSAPRRDCPRALNNPVKGLVASRRVPTELELRATDQQPLPNSGNFCGFLTIILKTDLEMAPPEQRDAIINNFRTIKTRGEAAAYMRAVKKRVEERRLVRAEIQYDRSVERV